MSAREQLPLELPPAADHWTPAPLRHWRLAYEGQSGAYTVAFTWQGRAINAAAADNLARHALAVRYGAHFNATARQTACIEGAAA